MDSKRNRDTGVKKIAAFTWRALILDDELWRREVSGTVEDLLHIGFHVQVAKTGNDLLEEQCLVALGLVDIALVDCQWTSGVPILSFPSESPEDKHIPEPGGDCSAPFDKYEYVRQWLWAIQYHKATVQYTCSKPGPHEWPKAPVEENDVGLWLGAMLANINPDVEVILWSRHDGVWKSGALAALGLYPGGRFRVLTKDPEGVTHRKAFWQFMELRQAQVLKQRSDLAQWFLACVYIPIVAGKSPDKAVDLPGLKSEYTEKYEPKIFFPQLTISNNLTEGFHERLRVALVKVGSGRLEAKNMESVLHSVDNVQTSATKEKVVDNLKVALSFLRMIRPIGLYAYEILQDHLTKINEKNSKRPTWRIPDKTMDDLRKMLSTTWKCFGDSTGCNVSEEVMDKKLKLPFMAVEGHLAFKALEDNHARYGGTKKVEKSIFCKDGHVVLEWLDDSAGFQSIGDLLGALANSAKNKGCDRGLPLLILFGVEGGCDKLEFLVQNQWHDLFTKNTTQAKGLNKFGVRWFFPRGQTGGENEDLLGG